MTPALFIKYHVERGLTKTAAVEKLAEVTGTTPRVAWRWASGEQPRGGALLLLQLWQALPEHRHLFKLAKTPPMC